MKYLTQEFVKATIAYQKKVNSSIYLPQLVMLDGVWKKKMSLDTNTNTSFHEIYPTKELGIEAAKAAYLEVIKNIILLTWIFYN